MELKHDKAMFTNFKVECFNRTFMELKLETFLQHREGNTVLIGPSWN